MTKYVAESAIKHLWYVPALIATELIKNNSTLYTTTLAGVMSIIIMQGVIEHHQIKQDKCLPLVALEYKLDNIDENKIENIIMNAKV